MATTKRASSSGWKSGTMGMSLGAIIIAALLSILLFVSYVSRPDISVIKGVPVITQGLVVPAILIGVVVWALVEYSTPPGKGILSLLGRFVISFIVGGFVGGYLGYEFHFGAYVLTPSFAGNEYAEFFLAMSFLAVFSLIWTTAWAHTHGFKGIRTSGSKVLNFKESGPSKVKRVMVALFVIVAVMVLLVPAGAELGHLAASGHDVDTLGYCESGVNNLCTSTQVFSVRDKNSASSFTHEVDEFGYETIFEMPSHKVTNKTGALVTEFYNTAYITTNLTEKELNNYALSEIQMYVCNQAITANVTIGTGVAYNPSALPSGTTGTNATTFVPIETYHMNDTEYAKFYLQPDMFLGNQSLLITYEIQTTKNITTNLEMYSLYTGNPSGITIFWPYSMIQASYLIGGALLLIFIPVSIPMIDMDTSKVSGKVRRKNGGRR